MPLTIALAPLVLLLSSIGYIIASKGASSVVDYAPAVLLSSTALAIVLTYITGRFRRKAFLAELKRSAAQTLPALPMLICIAIVATTWMMSGVVPMLISCGISWICPGAFLVIACGVSAVVSVLTGSSWSTIATIGVAFMGIGSALGFSVAWTAGAIISGAYFGDKVSPLSDTTVVASGACGVDLFKHIRYLMLTSIPAMAIALIVYGIVGMTVTAEPQAHHSVIVEQLAAHFNLTPLSLVIPLITLVLIAFRVNTIVTLAVAGMLGFAGIFVFQDAYTAGESLTALWSGFAPATGYSNYDDLVGTGGVIGMLPTVWLVLSAMMFGATMMGTGMLSCITEMLMRRIKSRFQIVGVTVAGGLCMNSATSDQYLSLIVTGNMFKGIYRRNGLESRLLSRTVEDSVSVTSVLIPWNSCGITQSTVLGVPTIVYLPFCIFNILSPCMSLVMAYTGFKIKDNRQACSSQELTPVISESTEC